MPVNGGVTYSNNSATTHMENATFSCHPGYTLTGDIIRTCNASGNWGGTSPSCIIIGRTYPHEIDVRLGNSASKTPTV